MFKNAKGKTPKDSAENIKNLKTHWQITFNRHAVFDETLLKGIYLFETIDSFGQTPEKNEIKAAIKK